MFELFSVAGKLCLHQGVSVIVPPTFNQFELSLVSFLSWILSPLILGFSSLSDVYSGYKLSKLRLFFFASPSSLFFCSFSLSACAAAASKLGSVEELPTDILGTYLWSCSFHTEFFSRFFKVSTVLTSTLSIYNV